MGKAEKAPVSRKPATASTTNVKVKRESSVGVKVDVGVTSKQKMVAKNEPIKMKDHADSMMEVDE